MQSRLPRPAPDAGVRIVNPLLPSQRVKLAGFYGYPVLFAKAIISIFTIN
jgi:hypothetical protein